MDRTDRIRGGTDRRDGRADRGASEVISVLLMVAVTIVLAAMVGTVMLNLATGVEDSPMAGANVQFDDSNNSVSVLYAANNKDGTTLDVKLYDDAGSVVNNSTLTTVGERVEFSQTPGDYRVVIVAEVDGQRSVVMEKDGSI